MIGSGGNISVSAGSGELLGGKVSIMSGHSESVGSSGDINIITSESRETGSIAMKTGNGYSSGSIEIVAGTSTEAVEVLLQSLLASL
jgi:hypothetical protein